MREVTLRFINALRAAGLRISVSESMDAMQAVAAVGVEQERLREALAASVVKEEEDRPLFDETFARFFASPRSRRKGKPKEQTGSGTGQQPQAGAGRSESPKSKVQSPRSDGQRAESQKAESPKSEVERQKSESLKVESLNSQGQSLMYHASRVTSHASHLPIPNSQPLTSIKLAQRKALLEKPFKAFDPRDVEAAKDLVEDLSRRLRGRLSRRYKPRKSGRLDFRRTIRASIARGGVPIDLLWRGRRPDKPDLVAFCDLSGSVAVVSDFLLALLAPAAEYFRRVHTFAYVDRLCEVSFEQGHVVPHATLDLYALSDFGKVLQNFWQDYDERLLTRNTLVLILGDARNNRRPPRPDLLARMRDHVPKLVWLNPEPRARWNTGDSVISRYAPACDAVLECTNLRELLGALGRVL